MTNILQEIPITRCLLLMIDDARIDGRKTGIKA